MMVPPDRALEEFRQAVSVEDAEIDLARAALIISKSELPRLEIEPILDSLSAFVLELRGASPFSRPRCQAVRRASALCKLWKTATNERMDCCIREPDEEGRKRTGKAEHH